MEAKKARIAQNPSRDIVAFVTASPSSLGLVFFKAGLPCLSRCISTQSHANWKRYLREECNLDRNS